jgi:hypothetical protein
MQIKQALHEEDNRTERWVKWIPQIPLAIRAYIVCNTWNLVGPDRLVTDGFRRIGVVDKVVEQPEVLHIKYWSE